MLGLHSARHPTQGFSHARQTLCQLSDTLCPRIIPRYCWSPAILGNPLQTYDSDLPLVTWLSLCACVSVSPSYKGANITELWSHHRWVMCADIWAQNVVTLGLGVKSSIPLEWGTQFFLNSLLGWTRIIVSSHISSWFSIFWGIMASVS